MRRLVIVNALIFAVLAAAVALAYYGYSASMASRERELQLMRDLAEEKVFNIESRILSDEQKVFEMPLPVDDAKLRELAKNVNAWSVLVLDENLEVVPGGYVSRRGDKEGTVFRDWFLRVVVPELPLQAQAPDKRGHVHGSWGSQPYLFSFTKRVVGGRAYYIVIEEDVIHLVAWVFPQHFGVESTKRRIYQVVDEKGALVYGMPMVPEGEMLQVEEPFVHTLDRWSVRVIEPDLSAAKELRRKRLFDLLFIGGAVAVLLIGLGFLALAIRRERRANELKSEFISNVSHELKTPLSIITMFGEMLANGRTKGPEQATEYADIIWRESVRLGRLIDNVLDFAKIERGKGIYEFTETDVGEVVERAVDLVGRRLTTAEMTIDVAIEPDLPMVQLDANAFTLAVMNLVDNATKYAAEGKKIELSLARQEDRIVLTVRDFGPGIDAAEQQQIFERFYRARAVRLKPIRGSGIGLALVRHIARAHHGDVEVESQAGEGATFRLWLPIRH